jgi:uncharacterized membrane protein YqhA
MTWLQSLTIEDLAHFVGAVVIVVLFVLLLKSSLDDEE